ncbi:unnamed protein product, partial [Discosporangium mesarthrocarpum]
EGQLPAAGSSSSSGRRKSKDEETDLGLGLGLGLGAGAGAGLELGAGHCPDAAAAAVAEEELLHTCVHGGDVMTEMGWRSVIRLVLGGALGARAALPPGLEERLVQSIQVEVRAAFEGPFGALGLCQAHAMGTGAEVAATVAARGCRGGGCGG